jgi:hypothetical protein
MKLRPLKVSDSPSYPRRSPGALERIKRTIAIASLSVASLATLAGCGSAPGASPLAAGSEVAAPLEVDSSARTKEAASQRGTDRHLEWCQVTPRLSGDRMAVQHFTCAPAASPSMPVIPGPPHITDGPLCQGLTSWARFDIPRAMRTSLMSMDERLQVDVISPAGERVARLGPGRQCLALDMEPGVWVIGVSPTLDRPADWSHFELFFEEVRSAP